MDRTTENFILTSFHLQQICKFRILPFVISRCTSDSCIFEIRNLQQFLPIHWNVALKDILKIASTSVILPSLCPQYFENVATLKFPLKKNGLVLLFISHSLKGNDSNLNTLFWSPSLRAWKSTSTHSSSFFYWTTDIFFLFISLKTSTTY